MAYTLLVALLLFHSPASVTAAELIVPTAAITAAPLVARDVTTIGYISTASYAGTTLWDTITANLQGQIIATSGSLWQICNPSSICNFYSCDGDYINNPTTTLYCGGASSTCSSYVLFTDVSDSSPLTNYWCDDITKEGGDIYVTTPNGGISSSRPSTVEASTTPTSFVPSFTSSSTPKSIPQTPSTNSTKKKKKTPVGAIAGGVIGGVIALAAVIFAIIFLLRRRRNKAQTQTHFQPQAPPPVTTQYYGNEQKPVGVTQAQQMPPSQQYYDHNAQMQQQQYNSGAQLSHGQVSPGGYNMPEKTSTGQVMPHYTEGSVSGPTSPVPMYSPTPSMSPANVSAHPAPTNANELPT